MLQAIIKKGIVLAEEVPSPIVSDRCVLIKVHASCISAGTEMSGVINSGKPLIKRAMEQPAEVMKVIEMAKSVGISKTFSKIKGTLDAGNPTGYSISGSIVALGKAVSGFKVGDRVAAAGAGIANHAEYVDVPVNLVMKMPREISFKEASTVTLGGIAMQGVRRADLRVGEFCVVTGAGILGLLSVQLLRLSGVRVATIDLNSQRLSIARKLGAEITLDPKSENVVNVIDNWTGGYGADAILFTAATSSSEPLSESFRMCKKKGKVVLVGVSGMEIKRSDIYTKELDFIISTSYGPGRYDRTYEEKGIDYPYAYVRWTENRNMTEYLRLVAAGQIELDSMIDKTFPISEVGDAFASLQNENKPLMVVLDYNNIEESRQQKTILGPVAHPSIKDVVNVALVGAGGFATAMHLPNMQKLGSKFNLRAVMSRKGHQAKVVAKQFGAEYATTSYEELLKDKEIDLLLVATRHDSHASLTLAGLQAGKHVFVEKPLATDLEELELIKNFYQTQDSTPYLFLGFNRRFSKYSKEIKKHTDKRINPLVIHYRMNAGFIPLDHWVHEDGGRIVGECCHIIDLISFFVGRKIVSLSSDNIDPKNDRFSFMDNVSINLKYEDGSIANIQYFSVGSKNLGKEFLEIHFDGKSLVMDDYKKLSGYGFKINELSSKISEKGQYEELLAIHAKLSGISNNMPIELWDIFQTTEASILVNKLASGN